MMRKNQKNSFWKSANEKWSNVPRIVLFVSVFVLLCIGAKYLSNDPEFNIKSGKLVSVNTWGILKNSKWKSCKDQDYESHSFNDSSGERHTVWTSKCNGERGDVEIGMMSYYNKNYEKAEIHLKRSIANKEAPLFAQYLFGRMEIDRKNLWEGCRYLERACRMGECEYFRYLQKKATCFSRFYKKTTIKPQKRVTELEILARGKKTEFIYDIDE